MKIPLVAILAIFLAFLGFHIWTFAERGAVAAEDLKELETELESMMRSRAELEADREFYQISENLEKELRARFNYQEADENMIIIVPAAPSRP